MQNEKNTQLERLIAKIDNDFNPDNSDWIPRVGAWAIDAMSQINVLPKEKVIFLNNKYHFETENRENEKEKIHQNNYRKNKY